MRAIMTDHMNSFWHVVLGALAVYIPILIPGFIAYQMYFYDKNSFIDLSEFGLGFLITMLAVQGRMLRNPTQ